MDSFPKYDWTDGNVKEAIPSDMPKPLGKDLDVRMMCNIDHAGEKRTRCSHTGFLIFCNTSRERLRQVYDGMYKFLSETNFGGH